MPTPPTLNQNYDEMCVYVAQMRPCKADCLGTLAFLHLEVATHSGNVANRRRIASTERVGSIVSWAEASQRWAYQKNIESKQSRTARGHGTGDHDGIYNMPRTQSPANFL